MDQISFSNYFTSNDSKNIFKIESLQRQYVWTPKGQIDELISDLKNVLKTKQDHDMGTIETYKILNNEISITDGQQRLTTISLIYAALKSIIESKDVISPEENEILFSIKPLLFQRNDVGLSSKIPHIQHQLPDKEDFESIVLYNTFNSSETPLKQAAKFIYKQLLEINKSYFISEIFSALSKFKIRIVENTSKQSGLVRFVKSSSGKALSASDYLKTFILSKIELDQTLTRLEYNDLENKICSIYTAGFKPEEMNDFWNYYAALRVKNFVPSQLQKAVEKYLDTSNVNDIISDVTSEFTTYSNIYHKTLRNSKINDVLDSIYTTSQNNKKYILFLGYCYKHNIDESDILKALYIWDVTCKRYLFTYGRFASAHFNSGIKAWEIARSKVSESKSFSECLYDELKTSTYSEYSMVSDDELLNSFITRGIYKNPACLNLLYTINRANSSEKVILHDCTIEHVIPKNTKCDKVHNLGNLTLLCRKDNSKNGTKPFKEKKELLTKSQLNINRYFDNLEEFEESDIDARTRVLCKLYCDLCPDFRNVLYKDLKFY